MTTRRTPIPSLTGQNKRKRIDFQKPTTAPGQVTSVKSAEMRFGTDVEGAIVCAVDPRDCVSLVRDRDVYKGGVEKMKRIFRGILSDGETHGKTNVTAGADAPLVVVITDTYRPYVRKSWREDGLSDGAIDDNLSRGRVWYGVVDGIFRMVALQELMEQEPEVWRSFKWSVLVMQRSPPMSRLRQMKRGHEESRLQENCITLTFYDELHRMHTDYVRLSKTRQRSVTSSDIAEAYDGKQHKSTDALSQKARTAVRLGADVIREIGLIMMEEHPCLASLDLEDGHPAKNPDEASKYIDCRVYRNFVNNMSLKQATNFISREHETTSEVQIHVLHRLRLYSRGNKFKAANFKYVIDQYHKARLATLEARKFETLLGTTDWPSQLMNFRSKLLRSNQFDEELLSHEGNGTVILPSLIQEYCELFPDEALRNIKKYNSVLEGDPQENENILARTDEEPEDTNRCEQIQIESEPSVAQPEPEQHMEMTVEERRAETIRLLKAIDVEVYNNTWYQYFTSVAGDDVQFDFVLSDPPFGNGDNPSKSGEGYKDHLTDEDFKSFSEKIFNYTTPGGYVFLRTSADYAPLWKTSLGNAGFKIWGGLFVMVRSMKGRQLRRKGDFPQVFTDFGVVGKKLGKHRDNFRLNLDDPYDVIPCKYYRRLGVIDKIPVANPKLKYPKTKQVVRTEECHPSLWMELAKTFCPPGGQFLTALVGH